MTITLISNPTDIQKEHGLINALFESGLDYFNLRKPDHTKSDCENFLRGIDSRYYKKISIHSHYEIIKKYNLRGIHISEKIRNNSSIEDVFKIAGKRNLTIGTSVHQINDIKEANKFDYVFLSPVYDSISKEHYKGNINLSEFKKYKKTNNIKPKVFALGGIDENKISEILDSGFDGIALLGAIWKEFEKDQNIEKTLRKFKLIKSKTLRVLLK